MDPERQFQVGESVLLVKQGVITTVTGYEWSQSVSGEPSIVGYKLSCGISAPFASISKTARSVSMKWDSLSDLRNIVPVSSFE